MFENLIAALIAFGPATIFLGLYIYFTGWPSNTPR